MNIKAANTFEKKWSTSKEAVEKSNRGFVDFLRFQKGQSYSFYILPKVTILDKDNDNIEVDYPFEEIGTHFGVYPVVQEHNIPTKRINCKIGESCPICSLIRDNKGLGKDLFKMLISSKFYLCYVIHDKKVKIAFFPDYIYGKLLDKTSTFMASHNESLVDTYRYKITVAPSSTEANVHEVSFADTAGIQSDDKYLNILEKVFNKPLDEYINEKVITDTVTLKKVASIIEKTYLVGNTESSYSDLGCQNTAVVKSDEKTEELEDMPF